MKALVFHHPGSVEVNDVPDSKIEHPEDVILRVTSTAICGSDLHIYNGFFPQLTDQVLGHEFMGVVEETGSAVMELKKGDRVVVPFPVSCGACFFCNHELPGHCENSNPDHYGPEGGLLDQKGGGLRLHGSLRRLCRRAGGIRARAVCEFRSAESAGGFQR